MARFKSNTYYDSSTDNDSGICFDYGNSLLRERNSSTRKYNETFSSNQSRTIPFPVPGVTRRRRTETTPLIRFPSDGIIERIRPATMKNSENSDFIICQTDRGPYIAYRTPVVPAWVTKLVNEIELQQS